MKKILLLIFAILMFGLLCWLLFGSFNSNVVVGQQCGPEAVVPCVMHDITREVDLLDKYRLYIAPLAVLIFIISLVLLFKSEKNTPRKP